MRWIRALRMILTLQARNYFPHVYLGLAVATLLAFRYAVPHDVALWLLPPFVLGEQAVLAMILVAAHVYLERNEGSVTALAVTPLRSGEYVGALVVGSSVFACASGAVIWAGVVGLDLRVVLLLPPLLLMSILSGLLGLAFATRFSEFTSFLLAGSAPGAAVISLPVLPYFDVAPRWAFVWLPSDAALQAFALCTRPEPALAAWLGYTAVLAAFAAAGFAWVIRLYRDRVRYRLEPVYE